MKTVKIVSLALIGTLVLFSCKKNEDNTTETILNSENELALSETPATKINTSETYLYVTAPSGLSLREYANLNSPKLAVMPYGTRVKVISKEKNKTMKVDEISGGMNKVEFNQKKGFAFNGFLSVYFPPEKGAKAKYYAEELTELFPDVTYTEVFSGTASKPISTETIVLPNSQWHEAFYIAQQLFKIPKEFSFPSVIGRDNQTISEKKSRKNSWISELHISRNEDQLVAIEYLYKNKGYSKKVIIRKEDGTMKLSKTEIIE